MKYTKPQDARDWLKWRSEGAAHELAAFLDSLPDSFEIVPEGMVAVKWPSECTRGNLKVAARNLSYNNATSEGAAKHMLYAFAAIAPEEKKKRKVWLWEKDHPHYTERSWTSNDIDRSGGGWRKVGECEVDA